MKKKDDLSSTFLWKKKLFVLNSFMKKKMICPELFYEKKDDLSLTFLWKKRWFVLNFFMKKKMICPELSYWKKPNEVFLLNKIGNRVVW